MSITEELGSDTLLRRQPSIVSKDNISIPSKEPSATIEKTIIWLKRPSIDSKKPNLEVPKQISDAVGVYEWLSRTITDSEKKCPALLKENMDNNLNSNMSCKIPNVDPFHPSLRDVINEEAMPDCSGKKSYGKLVDGKVSFNDPEVVSATYRTIFRVGDFKSNLGTITPVVTTNKITDEFIEIDFLLKNGEHVKEVFIQPVPHEHLMKREGQKKPGIPLNILIIGIDSLSHANAQRKLPKVYEFLKKELGAFIFNGHSILGDATTPQITAMLTGLSHLEQYEARRNHKNPRPIDGWTWIYKQLYEHGYLTGYSGDWPYIAPFQLRLTGFKDVPTDFYARPFYQHADRFLWGKKNKCLASRTISKCQFDYINEVFDMFREKLKFFFSFNVHYSHNAINQASMIEPDLHSLLLKLRKNGHLNNTLLIVMGDHGARYGKMRAMIQGKLEERLPLFSMTFPAWFIARYPTIVQNLRTNTGRLTSWFDVYATFRHMLSYPEVPANLRHGKSLFEEIPRSRTCADANVEPHWCPCLEMSAVSVNHSHVKNAAFAAVEYINNLLDEHNQSSKYCQILTLQNINYALLERPNDKVLAFRGASDHVPIFRAKPEHENYCRYQLQILTSPNNGIYEVTVRYYNGWFMVSNGISRINKYGDQPECIASDLPHLRKYCICTRKV